MPEARRDTGIAAGSGVRHDASVTTMNTNGRKVTQKRGEVTSSAPDIAEENQPGGQRGFDPSVPSPARMWNYWVGGKDHFAADRDAASRIAEAMPALPLVARSVRKFLIARRAQPRRGARDQAVPRPRHRAAHRRQHARGGAAGGAGIPDRLRGLRPVGARARQGAADEHPRGQDRLHPGGPARHRHDPERGRQDARPEQAGRRSCCSPCCTSSPTRTTRTGSCGR